VLLHRWLCYFTGKNSSRYDLLCVWDVQPFFTSTVLGLPHHHINCIPSAARCHDCLSQVGLLKSRLKVTRTNLIIAHYMAIESYTWLF